LLQPSPRHPDQVMTLGRLAPTIGAMATDVPSAGAAPPQPQPQHPHTGRLVALGVVLALGLGGLAALVINRGDSGTATTTPPAGVTIEHNATVTTPAPTVSVQTVTAPPTTVQVTPSVTVQGKTTSTAP
jgi:hypothetical protein